MSVVAKSPSDASRARAECPECLTGDLNWLLAQAHHALATELALAFAPLGISPRGGSVLGAASIGSYTQKQLSELVGLDKTTMVAALDELEAAGLARRVPSSTDRRAHVIEVTPQGRRKLTAASKVIAAVQADVLASLPDNGDALMQSLATLVSDRLAEPAACKSVRRREPRPAAA